MTITKNRQEKVHIHTFTVRGRIGSYTGFPMDMLRYDQAWPATGEDAAKIKPSDEPVEIRLHGLSCTPDRWKSFGWSIVEIA